MSWSTFFGTQIILTEVKYCGLWRRTRENDHGIFSTLHSGGGRMFLPDNTYGTQKRLRFMQEKIERFQPKRVLDVGCGTGSMVTVPLARKYPHIQFLGIDMDSESIRF